MWRLVRNGTVSTYSTERDRRVKLVSADEVEAAISPKQRRQVGAADRSEAAG
jgi:hypothetical protein